MRISLFSGKRSFSSKPSGNASNAALVGAKTVNGPSPERASPRPAAVIAATRVEKSVFDCATSTIVHGSAITAVVSDAGSVVSAVEPSAPHADRAISEVTANAKNFFFMEYSWMWGLTDLALRGATSQD